MRSISINLPRNDQTFPLQLKAENTGRSFVQSAIVTLSQFCGIAIYSLKIQILYNVSLNTLLLNLTCFGEMSCFS